MHESVLAFLKRHIHPEEIRHKRILEVGSCNVNGSPRDIVEPMKPNQYIGVDAGPGRGVDMIVNAEHLWQKFERESFDVVLSTQMLEHVVNWKRIVSQLKLMVRPNGLLYVTTASPGFPYHPYPIDVWRFSNSDFRKIFSDMKILAIEDDPQAPGIFIKTKKATPYVEKDLSAIEVMRQPQK